MKLQTNKDVRQEALLNGSQPPDPRLAPPSVRRRWTEAVAMLHVAFSNGLRTFKTNPSAILRAFWFGLLLVCCSLPLRAEQFGLFTYEVVNSSTVTITDYPTDATGPVEIPAEIAGRPVTGIGDLAFRDCTGLTSLFIPSSVTNIRVETFQGCTGLTSINVDARNWAYASIGGVLLNGGHTVLILCPEGRTGAYAIPISVYSIGTGAFSRCTGLTSVTIPFHVTRIEGAAFSGCNGLSSITIPSSVNDIRGGAFSGCTSLTSVTIPASVSSIDSSVFQGCTGLTSVTIPDSVTSIGYSAFHGCTGLTSVTIPDSVTWIGDYAFQGCTGLTSVGIPSSLTSIGPSVFQGCTGLTNVDIPASVTSIDSSAFQGCTGLTNVDIPASVANIGNFAFQGCTDLTSIDVEAGNPRYMSQDGVLFNATITELIAVPGGRRGAVVIPSSVSSIGPSAFRGCTRLTDINVEDGNTVYASDAGALLNAARTVLILCPEGKTGAYAIPSGVNIIEAYAFSRCTGLSSVTISSSVSSIRWNAFDGCSGLTSVTIPSSVTAIGGGAFSGCTSLTSVTIPSSVASIGDSVPDDELTFYVPAFSGCTAITRLVFLGNAPGTVFGEFGQTAPGFTIYYLGSRSGFTSPTWRGFPATMIDETAYPTAAWLLEHGLWYDTDLHTDSDGDGVDLLMAYALDLDPRQNLAASLPMPVLSETTLSLNFHATAPGITYRAKTSTDLTNWTTTGVSQSAPGPDGRSTATIPLDAPSRFLRLIVED